MGRVTGWLTGQGHGLAFGAGARVGSRALVHGCLTGAGVRGVIQTRYSPGSTRCSPARSALGKTERFVPHCVSCSGQVSLISVACHPSPRPQCQLPRCVRLWRSRPGSRGQGRVLAHGATGWFSGRGHGLAHRAGSRVGSRGGARVGSRPLVNGCLAGASMGGDPNAVFARLHPVLSGAVDETEGFVVQGKLHLAAFPRRESQSLPAA